ncbi:membrane-bound PQQ-dependent dehydrogenase, glucose/quinate/shikimate family [Roseateles amylovorans]|uniref:Membrane-bound PQQ-dependent dehydrogenase, glucose/quinate/shikimate family n=1 Tax=Roseateles amylovorans TaxID=2978473 RepID=A0ABY6B2Q2_9BURK|nr:membrane-bound PQQ-dependent dehydrogenase, glucose/quinate/shikimate family [Roseateles amylovorans]UXH79111.1 membrane-bound PQQ-dependent dehydrogenase, glucose/quinate/shikimate family [Roseateles amylovorans]
MSSVLAPTPSPAPWLARILGGVLLVAGFVLLAAGGWLASVGGSWYYALTGLAWAVIGALMWGRLREAVYVYAACFIASLAWSLWEVGLDWWPLAARMGVPFIIGAVLLVLMPTMRRHLPLDDPRRVALRSPPAVVLMVSMAAFAAVALVSWTRDLHAIEGSMQDAAPASASRPTAAASATGAEVPDGEWHAYGRTAAGQRYSPLTQITAANVGDLKLAWEFHTGDKRGQPGDPKETTFEVTPLKIGERLFLCTPHQQVLALEATTGRELWRYDPQVRGELALQHLTCRGLSYQPPSGAAQAPDTTSAASAASATDATAGATASTGACAAKLFMPTADGRLIALDPATGKTCPAFGRNGAVDLWAGMPNVKPGAYYATSPVVVTRQRVIVGGTVLDNASTKEQSGVIRAYDIQTGALVWNWDSANPDATAPLAAGQTYTPNSPNSWSVASVDETLGLVYLPMGNQPPDQWGGKRSPAVEKHSSSVVALELATGRAKWVFQTVHHDLWDYDVPSQPVLVDLTVKGQRVPALVQPTKQGELFVLDRRDGTPVFPVTETPAPQGAAAGDFTAPTQPVSAISFNPPALKERDMWGVTMFDQLWCRIAFHQLRYEGRFTPPSTQGSIINPGNFGVFNWGSIAVDPVRGLAFTTPAVLAFTSTLVPRPDATTQLVQDDGPPTGALPALNENFGAPFAARMKPFTSPLGIPCQAPPWGTVAGVDLNNGRVVWRHRNGTVRDLSPVPVPIKLGVPSLGGPLMTAGGVAFLSGSMDDYVRAYDVNNGRQIWQDRLPAGGQATPMSYLGADGRQYLLVVAGGHGSTGTRPGDSVRAYALEKR